MAEKQDSGNDLVSRWARYFRDPGQFGDDEGRVQVATAAAVRAARRGATSAEAAEAGRAEAKKLGGTTGLPTDESRDSKSESLVERWSRYFRDPGQFGEDEARVQVATAAAVRAARRGATSAEAAEAGRAAASQPVHSEAAGPAPAQPRDRDRRATGPRMSQTPLIGEAVDVQQRQQLDGGTTLLSIEFLLSNAQQQHIPVVLRGTTLTGRIAEGDQVEVRAAQRSRRGQLFASRVYNHTQQHEVQAGVGPTGSWNWWRIARFKRIATIGAPLLILTMFVTWIAIIAGVANGWIPDLLDSSEQTVTVPDVTGLGIPEATDRLRNAGLRPVVDFEDSSQVEWGKIVRQTPPAGEEIQEGSSVYIFQAT